MHLPDHITLMEVRAQDLPDERAAAALTAEEHARRATFRHEGRRRSFAMGRYAARTLLAERLGCSTLEVPLGVRDDGSLEVPGTGLRVSVTHSGDRAAAAVSTGSVGVDLEAMRPRPESLFRFILGPEEQKLRADVPLSTEEQIVLFWSLKESVLKGQRTGLRRSPKTLRLEVDVSSTSARIHGARIWEARYEMTAERVLSVSWAVN